MPGLPPIHPGRHLADALDGLKAECGITRTDAARRLGVARRRLYDVIEGKHGVTADLAVRLEALGLSSAEFWLNLQQAYDLKTARVALADARASIERVWPPETQVA